MIVRANLRDGFFESLTACFKAKRRVSVLFAVTGGGVVIGRGEHFADDSFDVVVGAIDDFGSFGGIFVDGNGGGRFGPF